MRLRGTLISKASNLALVPQAFADVVADGPEVLGLPHEDIRDAFRRVAFQEGPQALLQDLCQVQSRPGQCGRQLNKGRIGWRLAGAIGIPEVAVLREHRSQGIGTDDFIGREHVCEFPLQGLQQGERRLP